METQKKVGFVALIGRPNVGKSTLMNRLIGQKIAITSNKPQTTRNRIQTVFNNERGQIIFVDTPGMHRAKNKLGHFMMEVAKRAVTDVDLIMWLVEPKPYLGEQDAEILERLRGLDIPVFLVINKADMVSEEEMLKTIAFFHELHSFSEIFATSALRGKNMEELVELLFSHLPQGHPFYDEDTLTDQPIRQIVAEMVREKALHSLNEEIPHGITVVIDRMKKREKQDLIDIDATIVCERDSHKRIIIGKGGAMIKKIGSTARYEIEHFLESRVNLQLWVKIKKDWRDSETLIRNFGYQQED